MRAQLAAPGPAGPKGDTGARGPTGPAGPGAVAIRYDATAAATATAAPVLDIPGLRLQAVCVASGDDVAINLQAEAPQQTTLQATFTVDNVPDPDNPPQPPQVETGSAGIDLAPGVLTDLMGPGATTGFARVNARAIVVAEARIITLDLVEIVDADADECSIAGTAIAAA